MPLQVRARRALAAPAIGLHNSDRAVRVDGRPESPLNTAQQQDLVAHLLPRPLHEAPVSWRQRRHRRRQQQQRLREGALEGDRPEVEQRGEELCRGEPRRCCNSCTAGCLRGEAAPSAADTPRPFAESTQSCFILWTGREYGHLGHRDEGAEGANTPRACGTQKALCKSHTCRRTCTRDES